MPDMEFYREEIKLQLTGGVLELEISDSNLDKLINSSLREIQRYINTSVLISVPFARCIDLSKYKIYNVTNVYRAIGTGMVDYGADATQEVSESITFSSDPIQMSQWQLLSGNGMYSISNYATNYSIYSTLQQVRNTVSTDLAFRYDNKESKLYINTSLGNPSTITVEYVPRYDNVDEISSNYWIDVLMRMALANTKIVLGRIRTRYTQSNALWTMDGDTLLSEGKEELSQLRERLNHSSELSYPID